MGGADVTLIVASDGREDFGLYTSELLRMEGVAVTVRGLGDGLPALLPGVVVLASDLPLTRPEADLLHRHAEAGGRLVFLAPHPHGAEEFGFAPTYRTSVEGFLRMTWPGLPPEPMQFHAALRHMVIPANGRVVAQVCTGDASHTPTGEPAIVRLPLGLGEAWFFLYDLPRSIAWTRQGDPRRSGLHGNHVAPGWRPADMFAGFLAPECAATPQADLQCHLLRHAICSPPMHVDGPEDGGVPWLWPFPDDAPTVLLLSSDEDWSTPEQFEALHDALGRYDARITWYLVPETCITPERFDAWRGEGHTFSIHPVLEEPLARTWEPSIARHRAEFRERFGVEAGPSVRNHAIPWVGYVTGARINAALGFMWDANYFTCPPRTWHYMTGGALPLPFVDVTGEVIPILQLPAQFSDETTLAASGYEFSLGLQEDEAVESVIGLLRANAERYHSLLCVNTHPVSFAGYSRGLWERVLAEAQRLAVPRMSLEGYAEFWETRQKVEVGPATPTKAGWTRRVTVPDGAASVSLIVPGASGGRFEWDGVPSDVGTREVFGVPHAVVRLPEVRGACVLAWRSVAGVSP